MLWSFLSFFHSSNKKKKVEKTSITDKKKIKDRKFEISTILMELTEFEMKTKTSYVGKQKLMRVLVISLSHTIWKRIILVNQMKKLNK
jgi:hypothetical protein